MKAKYTQPVIRVWNLDDEIMDSTPSISNAYNDQPALSKEGYMDLWEEE